MGRCLEMARFLSLFRHKDQFQMVELAENLQLSNLWLYCSADSWYRWMILLLFFQGSKLIQNETQREQHVLSWVKNRSVTTDASAGLNFGWKTNQIQRDYMVKKTKKTRNLLHCFRHKLQHLSACLSEFKNIFKKRDFKKISSVCYICIMNNLF